MEWKTRRESERHVPSHDPSSQSDDRDVLDARKRWLEARRLREKLLIGETHESVQCGACAVRDEQGRTTHESQCGEALLEAH